MNPNQTQGERGQLLLITAALSGHCVHKTATSYDSIGVVVVIPAAAAK